MVRVIFTGCLIFIQCAANIVQAATFAEELSWYRQSLEFSGGDSSTLEPLMVPKDSQAAYRLPLESMPWAGNYFSMQKGGVSYRWQNGTYPKAVSELPSAKDLTPAEIRQLSPIEKYDIFIGDNTYRSTIHEMTNRGPLRNEKPQPWEGFCNGVRCAGFLLPEPIHSVPLISPEGQPVVFEPADLKALAGASYFYVEKYAQMGSPTREGVGENRPHAAAFDIALRHSLVTLNRAFVIDSHLGSEIWNETVVGYKRVALPPRDLTEAEKKQFPSGAKVTTVMTSLETLGEVDIHESNRPTKNKLVEGKMIEKMLVGYDLITDAHGKVMDGVWHPSMGKRGVDFAWFAAGAGADAAYADRGGNPFLDFKTIEKLFKESVKPVCGKVFWL